MTNRLTEIIFCSIFYILFTQNLIKCETPVFGRCGRPGVPPKATKWLITPERSRFENKEKVIVLCKKDEFPLIKHEVECKNGRWSGKQARCGKHINVNIVNLAIFDCESGSDRLIVSQRLNQSAEAPSDYRALRPNSFHTLRNPIDMKTSANGSQCYSYKIRFEKKVQIWFLLIDIWVQRNESTVGPDLKPDLGQYRDCNLVKNTTHIMDSVTVFGYYFICDLKSDADFQREKSEMLDTIIVNIKTNFTEEVGLEAVFVGDIFTETMGSQIKPDCGQMHIKNIGVDAQEEVGYTYISCNDSFVDASGQNIKSRSVSGNPKHKFICNWNGQWVGQWPTCVPKISCSKEDIFNEMDDSVVIEEIGNVYYLNDSNWFAINESLIRYNCLLESDIMIGKNTRTCLKTGQWSSKAPFCTRTGISWTSIALILFAILIVFVLIVLFVFRTHSRRVNRELRETREEINGSQRKRYSEEFYADFKSENIYDNSDVTPKTLDYESIEYDSVGEQPRYEMHPHVKRPPSPLYLDMLATK